MIDDYKEAQNFGTFHYSCNTCGALVKDRTLHTAWHRLPAGGDTAPPETTPQVDDVKHDEKG
jgi:hypothetical protein